MDCSLIEPELIGFHFGTLDDETRQRVEQHLPECAACLRGYLETKRVLEAGARSEAPSELARRRLRGAVAAELGRRGTESATATGTPASMAAATARMGRGGTRRWRPVVVSLAVAAAVCAVVALASGALRRGAPTGAESSLTGVDTVHSASTSLEVM